VMNPSTQPDWREKAFEFAQETTKQVIALAAGVLTITVTFHEDLEKAQVRPATWPLQWSWACYAASVVGGVLTLMALTGNLERSQGAPSIYGWNVRLTSLLQLVAFAAGIVLTAIFAWNVLRT
jgi:di/tricarboxylate transporter